MPVIPTLSPHRAAAAGSEQVAEPRFEDIDAAHRMLAPLMEAIAAVGGPHCEVVLHDLTTRDLEHSVRVILNGHVSGRSVGGPSTNLGAEGLRDQTKYHNAYRYRARTSAGRALPRSSVYYRAHHRRILAAPCINRVLAPV